MQRYRCQKKNNQIINITLTGKKHLRFYKLISVLIVLHRNNRSAAMVGFEKECRSVPFN